MPRSGRNKNGIACRNLSLESKAVLAAPHFHYSTSLLNAQELICIRVNFKADVTFWGYAHQRELKMLPSPQRCAVIGIL
jgi:hypothetical protein